MLKGSSQNEGNNAALPPPSPNEENTFLNKNESESVQVKLD